MDLRLSTLTGTPIILLACQPTAQRPMLVQAKLGLAGHQGDTGEELTLVVAERRLRLVTTTRLGLGGASLTTTTIAVACAAAAAPDDSAAAGNKSPAPGFALEHSAVLCCSALLLAISAQGTRPPLC